MYQTDIGPHTWRHWMSTLPSWLMSFVPTPLQPEASFLLSDASRSAKLVRDVEGMYFMYQIWFPPVLPLFMSTSGYPSRLKSSVVSIRQPVLSGRLSDAGKSAEPMREIPFMYQIWVAPVVPLC